ncbi:MAG TPA: AsmA family protein [Methylophilaceae bacterium]|nr:AsmA family protein [Methylophilaceae bacterium]
MSSPNESGKRGKSIFLRATLAAVLLLIAAIAVGELLGWPFLRQPFERFASAQLHRTVRISEPFQLRLIGSSLRLKLGGFWISAPPGFDAPHLVSTNNAALELRYTDLYRLKRQDLLRVKSLEVTGIDARLVRHADGDATWHFQRDPNQPRKPFPEIEHLIATRGYAEVVDAIREVDLKLDFGTNESSASANNASYIRATGNYRHKPLKAVLATNGFLPVATRDDRAPPIRSKGSADYAGMHLDFDGTVSDLLGRQNIDGKFVVEGPSLSVLGNFTYSVLPVTDKFSVRGRVKKTGEIWNIDAHAAHIGKSDLSGRFRYDPRPETPSLSGELNGERLYIVDLFPAFGTRRDDGTVVKPRRGKLFADRPLDLPSLNKMDADIVVRLDHVDLGPAFAEPIRPFNADLTMDKGKLALAKIAASTAKGSLSGVISIDAHQDPQNPTRKPPIWRIDLQWKDINLEKWLKVSQERKREAKREGASKVPPAYMTGMLNGRTALQGTGNSTRELLSSLDGDILMYVRKGTISHLLIELLGLDVAQSLGIKLTQDEPLKMQCAVMDFDTKNGIVRPQAALIDTNVTLILIDGSADLGREELNLRLVAKPRNVSPFTLRSPLHIRGTFVDPSIRPESGPIAARVAGGIVLAFVNPLAALLPFVDPGSTDDAPSSCRQILAEFRKQPR